MVNPGFAGQKIVLSTIGKAGKLMEFLKCAGKNSIEVEVDGNITLENVMKLRKIGVDIFVAGKSSVFQGDVEKYKDNIYRFRASIKCG